MMKLWETLVERGVGGFLKPWQIKRELLAQTQARSRELVSLAEAERDAQDIRSGRKTLGDVSLKYALPAPRTNEPANRGTIDPAIEQPPVIEVSTRALLGDAIRREVNVAKAIIHAEAELRDNPQKPPDREINEDWLYRWRDYAGAVSSGDLQSLWGRLLAGELKSPGSYSFRTLEFIRSLSSEEAKEISLLSRFVLESLIVRSQKELLDADGISFGFLMKMQNLGVVFGVESVGLKVTHKSVEPDRFIRALRSNGRVLVVTHDDPQKVLTLEAYSITDVGKEVLRLGTFEPHERYLIAVGVDIKKQDFQVSIAKYRDISESEIQWFDPTPL